MRPTRFSLLILVTLGGGAQADNLCFAVAETYYEQVYCQLQAKAQIKSLPSFHQFKKNDEHVQYSLLKRPAEYNAIKLPSPLKKVVAVSSAAPFGSSAPSFSRHLSEPLITVPRNTNSTVMPSFPVDSSCELSGRQIRCVDSTYELQGNKANHRLVIHALDSRNLMVLPKVSADSGSLGIAYEKYIGKMCEIGLCGVTMTFKKFAYLYQDLQTKGLDFSQRFETMFSFLKKDKMAMAVNESISVPVGISLAHCSELGDRYYACDYQDRNYIFELHKR
jgi:hypothetical protein